jgi:hypothetical protein
MADPLADIEVHLRQPIPTPTDANNQRRILNESFRLLTPDQAAQLLERILTLDGSRLQHDFRRPHRAVRLELLLALTAKLGTQTSAKFHSRLTGTGSAADEKLRKGLVFLFPQYAKVHRDRFLRALNKGVPTGIPTVRLEFRSQGQCSVDNRAKSLEFGSRLLGLDPVTGHNRMEIRGTVSGHRPDAKYRFSRTVEFVYWYLARDWKRLENLPAGTADDTHNSDEDPHPDNDHIYSIDATGFTEIPPGLHRIPSDDQKLVTEVVHMLNATETVEVQVDKRPWAPAAQLNWFSVSWLEKTVTNWRRKTGLNRIAQGSIDDLGISPGPSTVF